MQNWPAYLLTLLKKAHPDVVAERHEQRAVVAAHRRSRRRRWAEESDSRSSPGESSPESVAGAEPPAADFSHSGGQ